MSSIACTNRCLVAHYLRQRLHKEGLVWNHGNEPVMDNSADWFDVLLQNIILMADEFEKKYTEKYSDMCQSLEISDSSAEAIFETIVHELFLENVQWGRVVALIYFSGSFAVECQRKGIDDSAERVCQWTTDYLNNNLSKWIEQKGGWDDFVEFSRCCHANHSPWPPISTICKYAVGAVGLITLATIFSSRC